MTMLGTLWKDAGISIGQRTIMLRSYRERRIGPYNIVTEQFWSNPLWLFNEKYRNWVEGFMKHDRT